MRQQAPTRTPTDRNSTSSPQFSTPLSYNQHSLPPCAPRYFLASQILSLPYPHLDFQCLLQLFNNCLSILKLQTQAFSIRDLCTKSRSPQLNWGRLRGRARGRGQGYQCSPFRRIQPNRKSSPLPFKQEEGAPQIPASQPSHKEQQLSPSPAPPGSCSSPQSYPPC